MSELLPESLSPFYTHHPASSAYRITLSPHEWTWTKEEQEAMAAAIVKLDAERQLLKAKLSLLDCSKQSGPAAEAQSQRPSPGSGC